MHVERTKAFSYSGQVRQVDGWHIEVRFGDFRLSTEILNDLHEHTMSIAITSSFVGFSEIVVHLLGIGFIQLLNERQRSFAESLTDGIEEHEYQINKIT